MKGYIKLVSVLIIVMAFAVASSADTPPASITNLQNTTYEETYIEWTWVDPTDSNFTHVMVYIDGVLQSSNTTKGVEFFNATGLSSGVNYEIATHTVGINDSINTAWENETAETKSAPPDTTPPASITSLKNTTYKETYIDVGRSFGCRFQRGDGVYRWCSPVV